MRIVKIDQPINFGQILALLIIISAVRPVFYWVSPAVSRVSDLAILFLSILILAFHGRVDRRSIPFIVPYALYIIIMIASILAHSIRGGDVIGPDFVELARPLFWISGILLGYTASKIDQGKYFKCILNSVIIVSLINSAICWIMIIWPDHFIYLYQIYNVPNLYYHGRPGGIAYTHTEFVAINVLGIFCLVLSKIRFWYIISAFLAISCILPESKAGLILLGVFLFLSYWASMPLRRSIPTAVAILPAAALILIILLPVIRNAYPYIYYGFSSLFSLLYGDEGMSDGSIGPRATQWLITFQRMWSDPLIFLLGNSPMRAYPEISYIENTATNVLFRFGISGFLLYYLNFVLIPILDKQNGKLLACIAIAIFVADCTANISESIKFMFILSILFGLLIGHSDSINYYVNSNNFDRRKNVKC